MSPIFLIEDYEKVVRLISGENCSLSLLTIQTLVVTRI